MRGHALPRQRGADVVTCASETVWLVPAATYASKHPQHLRNNQRPALAVNQPDDGDPRYPQDQRNTPCDAQGDFRLAAVADGDYFVVTTVA